MAAVLSNPSHLVAEVLSGVVEERHHSLRRNPAMYIITLGKGLQGARRTSEAVRAMGDTDKAVSVGDLLKLLTEERKLRAEEEQRRLERELEAREVVETEHRSREEEWRAQLKIFAQLAEGQNQEGEHTGPILREAEANVAKLTNKDDIEAYLATFERMMTAYEVNSQRWVYKLVPQLSRKAQQAYAALPADEAKDYDQVKSAILRRYDISEETY